MAVAAAGTVATLSVFAGSVRPDGVVSARDLNATTVVSPPTEMTLPSPAIAPGPSAPVAASPPESAAPGRPAKAIPATPAARLRPFSGLGTWVDKYSWSNTYTAGEPTFGPGDIDAMARQGVQTLYLQGAAQTGAPGPLEPDRLLPLIARAHRRGVRVVLWYLPTFTDASGDYARLLALDQLPVDGIGVDIESRADTDVADRNAHLVALSQAIRRAMPRTPLGAIVVPPTVMEVVNPNFWPAFPWLAIAPYYDAWLPMAYWTGRRLESGFRDGYTYTADSVIRLRKNLGLPKAAVHPIGGVAGQVGPGDVDRFVAAIRQTAGIGGSMYDWRQTSSDACTRLHVLPR